MAPTSSAPGQRRRNDDVILSPSWKDEDSGVDGALSDPIRRLRHQEGFILQWTLMAALVGVFVVVPVVVLAGSFFRGQGRIEDATRSLYAADAAIHAVIEDLIRGADARPISPFTYTPPTVDLGEIVPSISVDVVQTQTLATVKPISYRVAVDPVLVQGSNPSGGATELAADDDSYCKVRASGTPPLVVWEVTSEVIGFPTVSFGDVRIVARSSRSSTRLEVFIFNPDDPLHTVGGYNPIADVVEVLDAANAEETISVALEAADVTYLNSLSTKTLKIKVRATRNGGFRLETDAVAFAIAGVVTTDERNLNGEPVIDSGTLQSGSASDLEADDTSYYTVSSSGNVVRFEVTSDDFVFSDLDTVSVPFIVRSTRNDTTFEVFVYNPADPAHTDGGYDTTADLSTVVALKNTDKAVMLALGSADLAYLNTNFPISVKLRIRARRASPFQLQTDMLNFIATSVGAPAQVVRQITQQYVDPGLRNPAMARIASGEGYLLRVYYVQPGLAKVNWAAHTPNFSRGQKQIQVFRGLVIDDTQVVPPGRITSRPPARGNDLIVSEKSRKPFVQTDFFEVDRGLYTIVFFNRSNKTMIAEPFAATGNDEDTWIYIPAFRDYVVDSSVGNVGLKAVIRQVPGPVEPPGLPWTTSTISWIRNRVSIQSWEPYGTE